MSADAMSFKNVNIDTLDYGKEVNTNKNTGAKSVNVSTVKGSNDVAHKLRFQLGVYDTDLMRAPFGVSKPVQNQENSTRRDLDLSVDSDEMLDFLRRLDEKNLQTAVDNAMDWWKKPLEKAVLRDRFKPVVKEPTKVEYRPTVRTKITVDADRNNTQIFRVTKETPSGPNGPGHIDEYVPATMHDIERGSKVMAIVEANGLWLGANQFGMTLNVTHLIVWPARQTRGIEAFMGLGAPKCTASMPHDPSAGYLRPTTGGMGGGMGGGMYGNVVDEDMIDSM